MPGGPNTFPSSILTLGTLTEFDTPALLDIRNAAQQLRGPNSDVLQEILGQVQQAFDNIQQTLRSASPNLSYLQLDAADIATLFVGGEFGPGEFSVLNGPPDYAPIGWIGSRAKSTTVALTSIVAGLVTSAAPHQLKGGDNVYIEATTDALNTGFYVVATTPLTTTFTVVGGVAGGNSTGGTMTKQFQGGWVKMFACGGTAYDDAPFLVDVDGTLSITDALITLNGSGSTIILDPIIGTISVTQVGGAGYRTQINNGYIVLDDVISLDDETILQPGFYQSFHEGLAAIASSKMIDLYGYTGATEFGPLLSLSQARGTVATPTATQSGDTIGGIIAWGFDGTGESEYAAGIRAIATENHGITAHGTKLIFEVTPNSATSTASPMTLDQDGKLNVAAAYKVASTQVLGTRKTGWGTPSGTLSRLTFDQSTVTLAGLAQRVAALVTDLISHGAIGA